MAIGSANTAKRTFTDTTDFLRVSPVYSSEGLLYSLSETSQTTTTAPGDSDEGGGQTTITTGKVTHILYFAGRPVGQWSQVTGQEAELLLLTTDHLGAPILATDLSGGEVWSGWLEPFGKPVDLRLPPGSGGDGDTEGGTDADDPNAPLPPPPEEPDDDGREDPPPPEGDPDGRDGPVPDPEPSDPNPNPDGREGPTPTPDPSDPNPNPDGRLVLQIPPAASIEEAGIVLRYPGQWEHDVFQTQTTDGMYYNVHRWYEPGTGRYGQADPLRTEKVGEVNVYLYARSNSLLYIDPLGLISCKCDDDCPGGEWLFDNVGFSIAVIGGISRARGVLKCTSSKARVPVSVRCGLVGPILSAGVGFEGATPFLPSTCGCNVDDVVGEQTSILGSAGPVSATVSGCGGGPFSIGDRTLNMGLGKSFGAGLAIVKCTVEPRGLTIIN